MISPRPLPGGMDARCARCRSSAMSFENRNGLAHEICQDCGHARQVPRRPPPASEVHQATGERIELVLLVLPREERDAVPETEVVRRLRGAELTEAAVARLLRRLRAEGRARFVLRERFPLPKGCFRPEVNHWWRAA